MKIELGEDDLSDAIALLLDQRGIFPSGTHVNISLRYIAGVGIYATVEQDIKEEADED